MSTAAAAADAGESMIVMGRIAGAWGVRGWIKVVPYSGEPDALLMHACWWLRRHDGEVWQPRQVEDARRHGAALVARFAELATPEEAQRLRGAVVGVPRAALPAAGDDEIYLADLPGLAVVNRAGAALGRVDAVQDYGAHPVLRVTAADGKVRLIPFVAAHVDAIDLDARQLTVDWGEDY
jgi:16S rRNA processing protein RimM